MLKLLFLVGVMAAVVSSEALWIPNGTMLDVYDMSESGFLKAFHENVVLAIVGEIKQLNENFDDKLQNQHRKIVESIETIRTDFNIKIRLLIQVFSSANPTQLLDDFKSETKTQMNALQHDMQAIGVNLKSEIEKQQLKNEQLLNQLITQSAENQNTLQTLQTTMQDIITDTKSKFVTSTAVSTSSVQYPHNCEEALNGSTASGVYWIRLPLPNAAPFSVYCEVNAKDGTTWMIVQRRLDGAVDFYRNWNEYRNGFGIHNTEYFLGLELLHQITNNTRHELWIRLEDFENITLDAKYESFGIGTEQEAYALYELGNYSGDAGDSLSYHKDRKFTTKDVDNDEKEVNNCAEEKHGAWWYGGCYQSNLNGLYLRGSYSESLNGCGITWGEWHGFHYSLKYVHMAIRPIK